jgi:hypothetical protein
MHEEQMHVSDLPKRRPNLHHAQELSETGGLNRLKNASALLDDADEHGGGADRGDAGSQLSSGTTGARTLSRLRRALAEQRTLKRPPTVLRLLWWALVVVVVVNALLATVQVRLSLRVL